MVQHLLGIVACVGRGLDAEVPQHGVGFPTAKEHDGVLVNVGAEQGGGAARTEGASAEERAVDARDVLNGITGVA